jgi:diadenosine tetraphosphatase ApaH/serine/threonine PP2A family protein phosphatase
LRIALLSDIHANAQALDACLAHAKAHGAARFVFLGDFVGYGGDPQAVVRTIAEYAAAGAIAVKGNHDEAIESRAGYFNDSAQAALEHARATLGPGEKRFLADLPLIAREAEMCFVHASAASPARWDYIDSPGAAMRCAAAAQARHSFCGHVHDQALYFESSEGKMREFRPVPGVPIPVRAGRRWVAIVGSVGQPRDRNPASAYAMFDPGTGELTFYRVAYDAAAAAAQIRASGLPELLAYRVEQGI